MTKKLRYPGIGARIRKAYEDAGFNRSQIVRECKVAYTTINNWEQETSTPSIEFLEMFAAKTNVSVDWLRFGDEGRPVVEESRVEPVGIDEKWSEAVANYLATLGKDTPEPVREKLLRLPYKDLWLNPTEITDVHGAREMLERQWRRGTGQTEGLPPKVRDNRPNLAPPVDREKFMPLTPRKKR